MQDSSAKAESVSSDTASLAKWNEEQVQDDEFQNEPLSASIDSKAESTSPDTSPLANMTASFDSEVTAKDFSKSEAERATSIIQKEMNKELAVLQQKNRRSQQQERRGTSRCVDQCRSRLKRREAGAGGACAEQARRATMITASCPLAAAAYANHTSDIADVLSALMDKAQTQLDETRHADSRAAHDVAPEDQSTHYDKALSKAKVDNSEFVSSSRAEKAGLAEADDDDDDELSASLEDLTAMVAATAVVCVCEDTQKLMAQI